MTPRFAAAPDWGARVAGWILVLTLAGAALWLGAVQATVLCVVAGMLVLATLLSLIGATPVHARPAATILLATAVGLTSFTALQCVPLPWRVLARLSPHVAEVWSRALAPLGEEGPSWAPLTLDPGATRVEVLKGCAYLLAFVLALRVSRRPGGRSLLTAAIVLTGVVLSVSAVLHPAFGAKRLFGVYEPGPGFLERHIAPLLNPNHLAAYVNLAFCLALAATVSSKPPVPRPIAGATALLLGATQVWNASRGGVAAMVLGVVLVAALSRSARLGLKTKGSWLVVATSAAVAAGTLMFLFANTEDVAGELLQSDFSKLKLGTEGLRLAAVSPVFGVGRGAFETAFPAVRTSVGHRLYTHPENILVQWCAEWGFVVAIAAFVTIAIALRPGALPRFSGAAGAWSAIVVNAVHNLVDFNSETPGVALSTVVCVAMLAGGSGGLHRKQAASTWLGARAWVSLATCAACVLSIACVLPGVGHDVATDRRSAYVEAEKRPSTPAEMHVLTRTSILRHPGEPYFPFAVALRALRYRDENPVPWIAATLERAPIYAPAHLLLGRALKRHPAQARLEFRLAVEQESSLTPFAIEEAERVVDGYEDAVELLPEGPSQGDVLKELVPRLSPRLPATALRLDDLLSVREPSLLAPVLRATEAAVADLEDPAASWCADAERMACLSRAFSLSHRIEGAFPNKCAGFELEARAVAAGGDANGALSVLRYASSFVEDRLQCLGVLFSTAASAGQRDQAVGALDAMVRAGCADDQECANRLTWVAEKQRTIGNTRSALATYKLAYEKGADADHALAAMAELASETGLHREAAEYYERLATRHTENPQWSAWVQKERAAIVTEMTSAHAR